MDVKQKFPGTGGTMHFGRYGRTYQLRILSARDLAFVPDLDEGLWMATSAPVSAFRCDAQFLADLDGDGSGRIHSRAVRDAVRWLLARLKDTRGIDEASTELDLQHLVGDDTGRKLVSSARHVLEALGREQTDTIRLEDLREFLAGAISRPLNGDGVVTPAAAPEESLRILISDVVTATGGSENSGGGTGATFSQVQAFLEASRNYTAWLDQGAPELNGVQNEAMPLGSETAAAYELVQRHRAKVEAFYAQSKLLRFEPAATTQLAWKPPADLDASSESVQIDDLLRRGPIAPPNVDGALPLAADALNPIYADWVTALKTTVLPVVLGTETEHLCQSDWERVVDFFGPYQAYLAARQGEVVASIPVERLRTYRDLSFDARMQALSDSDMRVRDVIAGVRQMEKLVLFQRYLLVFTNNFVSFPQLYDPQVRALFELGSVVIDGRWLDLAVQVDDLDRHALMAKQSSIFTVYLEATRDATAGKLTIAVPVTSGAKYNISLGKRGVFLDIEGLQWDARVIKILEHPVSLREAIFAPFVRLGQMLAGKIESFSSAGEKQLQGEIQKLETATTQAPKAVPDAVHGAARQAGMFVGVSVALAALSSAFAFIIKTLAGLRPHQFALGVVLATVAVLIPVSLVAWLRLRCRDLSALLEGCGWAINARMRLTWTQGRTFTRRPRYPATAKGKPLPDWLRGALYTLLAVLLLVLLIRGARSLSAYLEAKTRAQNPAAVEAVATPATKP